MNPELLFSGSYKYRIRCVGRFGKRVQALLACAWVREGLSQFSEKHADTVRVLKAIECKEEFAINGYGNKKSIDIDYSLNNSYTCLINAARHACGFTCKRIVAHVAFWGSCCGLAWETIYKIYFNAKGPKYKFQDQWKTTDVTALVNGIVRDKALDRMPILADALQDAGLTDTNVLIHLQQDKCYLSDWVIWNVMGWD